MLYIRQQHVDEIVAHALEGRPYEVCGLLAGVAGRVQRVYRTTNSEKSPVRYMMEPVEQLRIMRDMDDKGLELVGIYHSHTHSAPYPSGTDVELAYYPDAAYLIISLADPRSPVVQAYRIVDGRISPEPMQAEAEAPPVSESKPGD